MRAMHVVCVHKSDNLDQKLQVVLFCTHSLNSISGNHLFISGVQVLSVNIYVLILQHTITVLKLLKPFKRYR